MQLTSYERLFAENLFFEVFSAFWYPAGITCLSIFCSASNFRQFCIGFIENYRRSFLERFVCQKGRVDENSLSEDEAEVLTKDYSTNVYVSDNLG